ncbi:MAG: class I SAM-dependent methyltransferase [Parvibaculaceae bacterium]|nr:class I SAM-dependent methyltransferase [Parvibaculaceae bacterium]
MRFYAGHAAAYAARADGFRPSPRLDRFLAALPTGARILELGCGAGHDSAEMAQRGFDVIPTDGSPEMAREAAIRLGRPVEVLLFGDLDAVAAYDGIWASACLSHVPARALGRVIGLIQLALRPGGLFYASYRAGAGESRDARGRHYTALDERRARLLYQDWAETRFENSAGGGGVDWLHVFAIPR